MQTTEDIWPVFKTEEDVKRAGRRALEAFCEHVEDEYRIDEHRMRVDLCGHLSNGHWALVECKKFSPFDLSPFIDAIDQAASYAAAIEYPVFIGPVYGTPMELSLGSHKNGLGALHLMASRLNVGFLWINPIWGDSGVMLRGQSLARSNGSLHSRFDQLWRYKRRVGSKTT
jgi:hypothetical protein